ncbi:vancomycin resistance protein VanW [Tissierella praeacuta DSM 18095]|uniref:Vancomycin resistance protein VanW n=1 Tax=Tissierella praeacuta DSM 18095 TaxID=1123404 RepID=A0A1M4YZ96_9FIRM|nr:VanW family protein [Tissierella praeacuta]SHF11134.1 vancomycin resistance protein VanW [Tissierella praeacuta DSM 18095]SUP04938.1 Uncharacterized vancomycin resistance protein [Tissierella praeacuta]
MDLKPIKRSKLRLIAGKSYYTSKRYIEWIFGGIRFSKEKSNALLPYIQVTHQTPLIRKLKDVDMYLQYNKIINLGIAVKKINKVIINPGETFSYWKLIGRPARWKGYKNGIVLFSGNFKPGVGGGLCQLSNLIYWMTIHTPLTVVERYRHSYDVFPDSSRTQPFGSGATCVYNYRDLMIKNETREPYQLYVEIGKEYLYGEWRSTSKPIYTYEVYEKDHRIYSEIWGGYTRHNILYRKKYNFEGKLIDDEYITENHAIMMYTPFLEEKCNN